jgi:tRNA pseudouridine38-40 synthase
MRSIAMEVCYDGTGYNGLQVQDGGTTIQGTIEEALSTITASAVRIRYAGRTDAGVHALGQVVSVQTDHSMSAGEFRAALNGNLPHDIRIMEAREVPLNFHPRYDAKRRWYRYLISTAPERIPFFHNYAHWIRRKLDVDLLERYCGCILGEQDFTSFASLEEGENPRRTLFECTVKVRNDFVVFDLTGNSFLRRMVRTIVGTFLESEKRGDTPNRIAAILRARDRSRGGQTAFAGGLYLMKVFY